MKHAERQQQRLVDRHKEHLARREDPANRRANESRRVARRVARRAGEDQAAKSLLVGFPSRGRACGSIGGLDLVDDDASC